MLKHCKIILLLFLGFIFSDCATMLKDSNQKVIITSVPPGAKIFVDSLEKGVTPLLLNLNRKDNHKFYLELKDHEKYSATITSSINPLLFFWIIPDFIFGLWVGGVLDVEGKLTDGYLFLSLPFIAPVIDVLSGGMSILTPEIINATLQKSETASTDVNKNSKVEN